MKAVKIKGKTHKMKNRIREHGDIWVIQKEEGSKLLMTPLQVRDADFHYAAWLDKNKDIEIVKFYD